MLLEVKDLTKIFYNNGKKIRANDNISFSLKKGDIVGILGPNGAGKTTLIKQIATLLIPDKGDILYNGVSIIKNPGIIKGHFSFLSEGMQNIYHYLTGEANILYFAYLNRIHSSEAKRKSDELLKRLNLYDNRKNYVFTYSSGMNKRLAIATCLINDPDIVFLDEPLSGLDVIAAEELSGFIMELAHKTKKTFIIASHRMDFIERVTNRVLWLRNGKIIKEGNTKEIKSLSGEQKITVYLRSSGEIAKQLKSENIRFEDVTGGNTVKITLSIPGDSELLSRMITKYEVLNLEKKEQDFETIFKELYNDHGN